MIGIVRMFRALWLALGPDGRRAVAALPRQRQEHAGFIIAGAFFELERARKEHEDAVRERSKWTLTDGGKVRPRS